VFFFFFFFWCFFSVVVVVGLGGGVWFWVGGLGFFVWGFLVFFFFCGFFFLGVLLFVWECFCFCVVVVFWFGVWWVVFGLVGWFLFFFFFPPSQIPDYIPDGSCESHKKANTFLSPNGAHTLFSLRPRSAPNLRLSYPRCHAGYRVFPYLLSEDGLRCLRQFCGSILSAGDVLSFSLLLRSILFI